MQGFKLYFAAVLLLLAAALRILFPDTVQAGRDAGPGAGRL